MRAIEYGEMVQTNGKWVWRSTEDPVLKLMRDKGVITNERYNEVSAQKGKNWIEPADAVLNRRQRHRMDPLSENRDALTRLD